MIFAGSIHQRRSETNDLICEGIATSLIPSADILTTPRFETNDLSGVCVAKGVSLARHIKKGYAFFPAANFRLQAEITL